MPPFDLDDDVDDDLDEDDDVDEDSDEDSDDDEEEDDAEDDVETWQVVPPLDFPALNCLDWREFEFSGS